MEEHDRENKIAIQTAIAQDGTNEATVGICEFCGIRNTLATVYSDEYLAFTLCIECCLWNFTPTVQSDVPYGEALGIEWVPMT